MKPRSEQAGFAEDFAGAKFAAASLDARGVVVRDAETARGVSGGESGAITDGENGPGWRSAKCLEHGARGSLGRLKMHGESAVVPGIGELMTAVGDVEKFNAERARGVLEAAGLVAELRGKEEDALGFGTHVAFWRVMRVK
jgi:hypothetical protein